MPVLLLLFIGLPLFELWLLFQIGGRVGLPLTLTLVLGTGVVGGILARREGTRAISEFSRLSAAGVVPSKAILDGLAVFVGGALLMTPGIVTDACGFLLLLRPSRLLVQLAVLRYVQGRIVSSQGVQTSTDDSAEAAKIIDQQFGPDDVEDRLR